MKASPCTGVCYINSKGICTGCLRTGGEITRWFYADEKEQEEILKKVEERKKSF